MNENTNIDSEITRIENAKEDIKDAIESKGVSVGEGTIDTYAAKVAEISSGPNIVYTTVDPGAGSPLAEGTIVFVYE